MSVYLLFISDLQQVSDFLPGTPVSSTSKTDHHDLTEILLKVALNTINQTYAIVYVNQRLNAVKTLNLMNI
jgi:hypothetical protein